MRWWLVEIGKPGMASLIGGLWSRDPEQCRCGRKCPWREDRECKGLNGTKLCIFQGQQGGAERKREC